MESRYSILRIYVKMILGPYAFRVLCAAARTMGKADGEGTRNGGDKPRGTGKGDGTLQG